MIYYYDLFNKLFFSFKKKALLQIVEHKKVQVCPLSSFIWSYKEE